MSAGLAWTPSEVPPVPLRSRRMRGIPFRLNEGLRRIPPLYWLVRLLRNVGSPANRGARLRAAARVIGFDVRTRLLRRPTVAAIGDRSKIICYPGESNAPHAAYRNPPNPREMFVWRRYLRPGDLFVDVGSNIGIYTLFALDLGAEVVACEPDAHNYARLLENLAYNRYNAETYNVAVADRPGTLRLSQGLDSLNHLVFDGSGVEVPAMTLDDIIGDRRVTGLKIDVEGAERLVLEGARSLLASERVDLIQLEWAGVRSRGTLGLGLDDVSSILQRAGYRFFRPDSRGCLRPVQPADDTAARDVFAVAPSAMSELNAMRQ